MAEFDDQLGQILGNPQIMQQIATLAQSLNAQQSKPQEQADSKPVPTAGNHPSDIDIAGLQGLLRAGQNMGIDKDQKTLLKALNPYLSPGRLQKLEKAMHAAKLAQFASTFMTGKGPRNSYGR